MARFYVSTPKRENTEEYRLYTYYKIHRLVNFTYNEEHLYIKQN